MQTNDKEFYNPPIKNLEDFHFERDDFDALWKSPSLIPIINP